MPIEYQGKTYTQRNLHSAFNSTAMTNECLPSSMEMYYKHKYVQIRLNAVCNTFSNGKNWTYGVSANIFNGQKYIVTCGPVVRVPGYRSRGLRSIPGATRFSANGVQSAS
jgi:hypothetical protein